MSVKKFKFVSPGIFIDEIDNTQLPAIADAIGPVVIGRARRGPALRPVKVQSFSEFVDVFGTPVPGGDVKDTWRNGNFSAPMYATYAAHAWLKNNTPLTFIRLLGASADNSGGTKALGEAGWRTTNDTSEVPSANGGAYGLFIIASASSGASHFTTNTGTLAAVWYMDSGHIRLSGSTTLNATHVPADFDGVAEFCPPNGSKYEFKIIMGEADSAVGGRGIAVMTASFNFDESSDKYIRKVFNTDPTLTNSNITTTTNRKTYWLGETYERNLEQVCGTLSDASATSHAGIILPLGNTSYAPHKMLMDTAASKTGWVISQDLTTSPTNFSVHSMQRLFRFHSLDSGEWNQNNIKISIQDINFSRNESTDYGTFSVLVRDMRDNDNRVRVIERYNNVNLNPNDPKYIARVIGDNFRTWNDRERRWIEYGDYDNVSDFIRVEMNEGVAAGRVDPQVLPFGYFPPPRFKGFKIMSGSAYTYDMTHDISNVFELGGAQAHIQSSSFVSGRSSHNLGPSLATASYGTRTGINTTLTTGVFAGLYGGLPGAFTASFVFPTVQQRSSSVEQNVKNASKAYWGFDATIYGENGTRYEKSNSDLLRAKPGGLNDATAFGGENFLEYSDVFTLDELQFMNDKVVWVSGSRQDVASITSASWKAVIDEGYGRFTIPMYGGFDGHDISEQDPYNNTRALKAAAQISDSYAYNTVKRAIDSLADPEVVEFNLAAVPGVTNNNLTEHLLNVCEDRGDALAIIDLNGGYVPKSENTQSIEDRLGGVKSTVDNLRARQINTSYGCAYYPWVKIRDSLTDNQIWVPPSVVALGTMANSEKQSELWFAPAGFTRGGLTQGGAGLPVLMARERLTADQRDSLYEANVNPIATFPAEGIVVFGQKTLQVTQSALDRINVRRLLIYVKKEVSRIAATTLFEPNVEQTWSNFKGRVQPFLQGVKSGLGLDAWKIILDETTTTPDLIDRNIMYAKIFLKPTRAIEYIAIDFTITNSGAAFED